MDQQKACNQGCDGWSTRALPYLFVLFLIPLAAGCLSRPFQTIMRGSMNMRGDMNMTGNMDMSGQVSTVMKTDNTASRLASVPIYSSPRSQQSKAVVVLDVDGILLNKNIGGIGSLGENPVALFREKLDVIATDPKVGAIVLRINSPGGGVTAADIMHRDLLQVKNSRNIPVVACLMDVGAGGGYYVASGADHIVAHPTSLVGGIGVILNIYFLTDMSMFSVSSQPVTSGPKINMATPDRDMELEERELLQGIANEFHQRFIAKVRKDRDLPEEQSELIFDGRVMTGESALANHLVDDLGYLDDAVVKARELADLPERAPVMMLRRDNDRAYTLLDVTPNVPTMTSLVPLKIPGLDRSQMPSYLYLWQPEPSMTTGI
ncbi:MAG: S49 family peptidase [Planctomycetota bacterium]